MADARPVDLLDRAERLLGGLRLPYFVAEALVIDLADEVRRLRDEVDRMRPVVKAAMAWADCHEDSPINETRDAFDALFDAVTLYRQTEGDTDAEGDDRGQ